MKQSAHPPVRILFRNRVFLVVLLCLLGLRHARADERMEFPTRWDGSEARGTTQRTVRSANPVLTFEDVTARAGIHFRHTIGDDGMSSLVESTGVGCAFLDYDNDGWPDLYLVSGVALPGLSDPPPSKTQALASASDRLYHNRRDGTFEEVTQKAGILPGGYGIGVLVGDYDNDGHPDIYVMQYGPNRLYRNNGDGTFDECAQTAGVADPRFSVGATFLDYDLDGDLDLFVGNYVRYDDDYNRRHGKMDHFPGPLAFPAEPDQLYRNEGSGRFTNVTATVGLNIPAGRAMGVGSFDYDQDGWPDIFVSNDAMENHFYHNTGQGTFKETALLAGVAFGSSGEATGAMAVEPGDVNGDGHIDFYVPDFTLSCLYVNMGRVFFDDQSVQSGLAQAVGQHIKWGAALADFDLDLDLDLYVAAGDANSLTGYPDHILVNDGRAHFTDVSATTGPWFQINRVGRGVAAGDFDQDGRIDLLVANLNDAPALLRNVAALPDRHWLRLKLIGQTSNRDAIGARVRCILESGSILRERTSAGSYCCSHDSFLHFGLGTNSLVPRLEIHWPSRLVQTLSNVTADQTLFLREPKPKDP